VEKIKECCISSIILHELLLLVEVIELNVRITTIHEFKVRVAVAAAPENEAARLAFYAWLNQVILQQRSLIFQDESRFSVSTQVCRGRSLQGITPINTVATLKRPNITVMASLTRTGYLD
jgi:hypothetical protein